MPTQPLTGKLIMFPADWVARVDRVRGDVPFSEFVRQAVLQQIGADGLSPMPVWGRQPPKKAGARTKKRS